MENTHPRNDENSLLIKANKFYSEQKWKKAQVCYYKCLNNKIDGQNCIFKMAMCQLKITKKFDAKRVGIVNKCIEALYRLNNKVLANELEKALYERQLEWDEIAKQKKKPFWKF